MSVLSSIIVITPQNSSRIPKGSSSQNYQQLFPILKNLCKNLMITPLDFVERTNPSLNDPNMFNIHSAVLEEDPLNPPTISSTALWKLVKERSGVDPPTWQKKKAFNKLDDRRTGTISFARLCAGASLFDPGQSTNPSTAKINGKMGVSRWIDLSANAMMKTLQQKLQSKHKTNSNHKLFAHFARACNPATQIDDQGPTNKTMNAKQRQQHGFVRITYPHFIKGLKHYGCMNAKKESSHKAAKKLFQSFDGNNKGFFGSKVFINQGLNDGAQGVGNEVGQYSPENRRQAEKQANHKKNIRMKQGQHNRQKFGKTVTPSHCIEMLRTKICSKMVGYSNLEGYRIFKQACGHEEKDNVCDLPTFVRGCKELGLRDVPQDTLHLIFDALDLDSDGQVDYNEFIHILTLENIDVPQKHEETARSSHGGSLSLPQLNTGRSTTSTSRFATARSTARKAKKSISGSTLTTMQSTVFRRWKQMLHLFVAVDKNKEGELGRVEFADILSRFGVQATGPEFDLLFSQFDTDGGGTIDYKEFLSSITGKNNNELTNAFSTMKNLEQGIDMRDAKSRHKALLTNTIHADPEINVLLNTGVNAFSAGEDGYYDSRGGTGGGSGQASQYDVKLLKPIVDALQGMEIEKGVVSMAEMFKVLKWYGIDMTTLNIPESSTMEVRGGNGSTSSRVIIGIKYRSVVGNIWN
jgi:Ca2+-binding EF-hand superfamily protein